MSISIPTDWRRRETDDITDGEQGTSNPNLQWMIGGQGKWKTEFLPNVWYNFAYDIVRSSLPMSPDSRLTRHTGLQRQQGRPIRFHRCRSAQGDDCAAIRLHLFGSSARDAFVHPSLTTLQNGADWHLGVLRLPRAGYTDTAAEDWYFSGVYVESGPITASISGPSG